jgi:hypothetical protein
MRQFILLSVFFILIVSACQIFKSEMDRMFPPSEFEPGWRWLEKPVHYNQENLYNYINGEAELFLDYGFKECATVTFIWKESDDMSFVMDIYDMGTPLGGFGLYSNFRHPIYQYEKIGTEAIVSEYDLRFYQGRYVVELRAGDGSERTKQALWRVARLVADRIPDAAEPPELLGLLPREGQIQKTLRYVSKEMLNQSFLGSGFEAEYRIGNENVFGFVVIFEDSGKAIEGLDLLREFFEESGDAFPSLPAFDPDDLVVQTAYHGYGIFSLQKQFLAGVQDLNSPEMGKELILEIKRNLEGKSIDPSYFN